MYHQSQLLLLVTSCLTLAQAALMPLHLQSVRERGPVTRWDTLAHHLQQSAPSRGTWHRPHTPAHHNAGREDEIRVLDLESNQLQAERDILNLIPPVSFEDISQKFLVKVGNEEMPRPSRFRSYSSRSDLEKIYNNDGGQTGKPKAESSIITRAHGTNADNLLSTANDKTNNRIVVNNPKGTYDQKSSRLLLDKNDLLLRRFHQNPVIQGKEKSNVVNFLMNENELQRNYNSYRRGIEDVIKNRQLHFGRPHLYEETGGKENNLEPVDQRQWLVLIPTSEHSKQLAAGRKRLQTFLTVLSDIELESRGSARSSQTRMESLNLKDKQDLADASNDTPDLYDEAIYEDEYKELFTIFEKELNRLLNKSAEKEKYAQELQSEKAKEITSKFSERSLGKLETVTTEPIEKQVKLAIFPKQAKQDQTGIEFLATNFIIKDDSKASRKLKDRTIKVKILSKGSDVNIAKLSNFFVDSLSGENDKTIKIIADLSKPRDFSVTESVNKSTSPKDDGFPIEIIADIASTGLTRNQFLVAKSSSKNSPLPNTGEMLEELSDDGPLSQSEDFGIGWRNSEAVTEPDQSQSGSAGVGEKDQDDIERHWQSWLKLAPKVVELEHDSRGRRSLQDASVHAEECHSRNLKACGQPALKKLLKERDMKARCSVREEFLNCMMEKRFLPCLKDVSPGAGGAATNDPKLKELRSNLKKNLATNCFIGYSTPDKTASDPDTFNLGAS